MNIPKICPRGLCVCELYFLYQWRLRMQQQIREAESPENRYYFWLKYGREAHDFAELLMYYITDGGARDFEKNELAHLN